MERISLIVLSSCAKVGMDGNVFPMMARPQLSFLCVDHLHSGCCREFKASGTISGTLVLRSEVADAAARPEVNDRQRHRSLR